MQTLPPGFHTVCEQHVHVYANTPPGLLMRASICKHPLGLHMRAHVHAHACTPPGLHMRATCACTCKHPPGLAYASNMCMHMQTPPRACIFHNLMNGIIYDSAMLHQLSNLIPTRPNPKFRIQMIICLYLLYLLLFSQSLHT